MSGRETVQIGEILDGSTEFGCPNCHHMTTLSQEYDLGELDELTISCTNCHNSFGSTDPDEELPGYYVRWNGHEIAKYTETFACRNCKQTAQPVVEHGEMEEWRLLLYVLARLKRWPCKEDPEERGLIERVTERFN